MSFLFIKGGRFFIIYSKVLQTWLKLIYKKSK